MGRPSGLTVLMLHRIVERLEDDHDVRWSSFQRLIAELRTAGRRFSTDLTAPVDAHAVALTFDDGTSDHATAAQVLAREGIPAVFFVTASRLGQRGQLTATDVRELVSLGHVVGSHGWNHVPLDTLSSEDRRFELVESRRRLEDVTGAPVRFFAPPGGITPGSLRADLVMAGYVASRSTRWGVYRDPHERYAIPCIPTTELTMRRGWVSGAISGEAVPFALRLIAPFRALVPRDLRAVGRRLLHRAMLH